MWFSVEQTIFNTQNDMRPFPCYVVFSLHGEKLISKHSAPKKENYQSEYLVLKDLYSSNFYMHAYTSFVLSRNVPKQQQKFLPS